MPAALPGAIEAHDHPRSRPPSVLDLVHSRSRNLQSDLRRGGFDRVATYTSTCVSSDRRR